MERCPKDEPTAKNLVFKKALPISSKNEKHLLGVASIPPPPPLAIGGLINHKTRTKGKGLPPKNLQISDVRSEEIEKNAVDRF